MKTPQVTLNKDEFPRLGTWEKEYLNRVLDGLVLKANPSKKIEEITKENKIYSARMLEMDLAYN